MEPVMPAHAIRAKQCQRLAYSQVFPPLSRQLAGHSNGTALLRESEYLENDIT